MRGAGVSGRRSADPCGASQGGAGSRAGPRAGCRARARGERGRRAAAARFPHTARRPDGSRRHLPPAGRRRRPAPGFRRDAAPSLHRRPARRRPVVPCRLAFVERLLANAPFPDVEGVADDEAMMIAGGLEPKSRCAPGQPSGGAAGSSCSTTGPRSAASGRAVRRGGVRGSRHAQCRALRSAPAAGAPAGRAADSRDRRGAIDRRPRARVCERDCNRGREQRPRGAEGNHHVSTRHAGGHLAEPGDRGDCPLRDRAGRARLHAGVCGARGGGADDQARG